MARIMRRDKIEFMRSFPQPKTKYKLKWNRLKNLMENEFFLLLLTNWIFRSSICQAKEKGNGIFWPMHLPIEFIISFWFLARRMKSNAESFIHRIIFDIASGHEMKIIAFTDNTSKRTEYVMCSDEWKRPKTLLPTMTFIIEESTLAVMFDYVFCLVPFAIRKLILHRFIRPMNTEINSLQPANVLGIWIAKICWSIRIHVLRCIAVDIGRPTKS